MSAADAALAGAKLRLRPILMTAFAFILGVVPLAISSGSGAEARNLLGYAVIGGMLAASVIAIFLIPVSFYVVESLAGRSEAKTEPAPGPGAAPAPVAGGRE
jgi:HAE1 family hydrophobic/amphiphilic exporter-1